MGTPFKTRDLMQISGFLHYIITLLDYICIMVNHEVRESAPANIRSYEKTLFRRIDVCASVRLYNRK
jgi:hypothetical protein